MSGNIIVAPKSIKKMVSILEDQLEIARSLPGDAAQETRVELISQFLDRAREVSCVEDLLEEFFSLFGDN